MKNKQKNVDTLRISKQFFILIEFLLVTARFSETHQD